MSRDDPSSFFHKAACILSNHPVRAALLVLCACCFCGGVIAARQDKPQKSSAEYERLARAAYDAKDYGAFLENMQRLSELRPGNPRVIYSLAAAYALKGETQSALSWLNQLARWGLVYAPEQRADFAALKAEAEFQKVVRAFEKNRTPIVHSTPAFTLPDRTVIPESVAYDPATETFFVSSVYQRKMFARARDGATREFSHAQDGLWSVLGMKVDAARRLLWVTTSAQPLMMRYQADENGRAGVFKYDLKTGALLQKYLLPNQPNPHALGDLVISPRGEVLVTDSLSPAIYLIRPGSDQLALVVEGSPFVSPQGLDFTRDGKRLFVADYAKGIFLVEPETKRVTQLTAAPDVTLLGIDGLYFHQGALLAVQNGTSPHRVVRLRLNAALTRVDKLDVLEANNPRFDEPTLGVLVRDTFYFVANSQWGAIDEKGHLAAEDKLQNPLILKIDLMATPAKMKRQSVQQ